MGRMVTLPFGDMVPSMGLGTWHMGERTRDPKQDIDALVRGLNLGASLIDTAEMYARGGAERVVGAAIRGRRHEVVIVSKVVPHNASFKGTIQACENSLQRMGVENIDLYLLHWPGPHPLADTIAAFEKLKKDGKIKHWGVSNFDASEMEELYELPKGNNCQVNQVLYNLLRRGVEWDLLPWCRSNKIVVMAYSPLEQGILLKNEKLRNIAQKTGIPEAQLSIAWTLRNGDVISIPKAASLEHVEQNIKAWEIILPKEILSELDEAFNPPTNKEALNIL
jgi:diketogulonate reductase-like aldo/keto reductase